MTGWMHALWSWLQRRRGGETVPSMPEVSLREAFGDALDQAVRSGEACCRELSPEIFCLVVPPFDTRVSPEQHHAGIDACLEKLSSSPDDVASLTWSALLKADPSFEPSFRSWAGPHAGLLDGEIGIVFFVDLEAVGQSLCDAIQRADYWAKRLPGESTVRVHHNGYLLDIGLEALLVETLWTMRGIEEVAADRARVVPLEFAAYSSMAAALMRRFPDLDLAVDDGSMASSLVRRSPGLDLVVEPGSWLLILDGVVGQVPYRSLVRACRQRGLEPDAFLARCTFSDIVDLRPVHLKIKAPAFVAAYPDCYVRDCQTFVEVLARDDDDGTHYVQRSSGDPPEREQHLQLLRAASLTKHRFEGHLFRVEVGASQAICLAGEQAASLTADPALLAGVLAAAGWQPSRVQVRSRHERGLVISDPDVVPQALEVLLDTLHQLLTDLSDDAGDTLSLDLCMWLDDAAQGSAELCEVPGVYFELRDRADMGDPSDAPGRASYYRGLCYELLGRSEKAVECFSRALRFDREDGELNLLLGRTLNDLGRFDRATGFLERAVRALPEDADASNSLGVAYQCSGASQAAVRAFEHAAALSPDDPTILVNLGRAYVDTDRLDLAREILLRALERAPSLFEARASLAMVSLRTGEREDALEHARLALSSNPEDEAMRELVALLTEGDD
ncbi:MAG: tetratricopeptide repeat protein [Pseudomonadota bacterium]